MDDMRFADLVPDPSLLMGVKAVYGRVGLRIQCFQVRSRQAPLAEARLAKVRTVAERAAVQPFLLTIGGGKRRRRDEENVSGRVLEVMRLAQLYGETADLVAGSADPAERTWLEQWPVAVVVQDVFEIEGLPHLVKDLSLPDRTILSSAFDNIVRPSGKVEQLWEALGSRRLLPRDDLPPIGNFRAPQGLFRAKGGLPVGVSADEGQRLVKESVRREREPVLARRAKEANRARHGGRCTCLACGFADADAGLLDVHHLVPLSLGQRQTVLADLVVLCPTCHRIAHRKAAVPYDPLPVAVVRDFLGNRAIECRSPASRAACQSADGHRG